MSRHALDARNMAPWRPWRPSEEHQHVVARKLGDLLEGREVWKIPKEDGFKTTKNCDLTIQNGDLTNKHGDLMVI